MKSIQKDVKKIVINEKPKGQKLIQPQHISQDGKINDKKYQINITKDMPFTIKIY